MGLIDLHVHSNHSDGSLRPSELVSMAKESSLCAFALTDHDTVSGINEAVQEGKKQGVKVIPGIEISAEYKGMDIHILGLNIDYKNTEFINKIKEYADRRILRNKQMLQKMQELGFDITEDNVKKRLGDVNVITRAHYAIMFTEAGYTKDNNEAFTKYLDPGCPCYISRVKVPVTDAVKLIISAGGKPVIAHPVLYKLNDSELDELISLLKSAGLMGIEAIYSKNKEGDEQKLRLLAEKYKLFITGGSDFHGDAKPGLKMGSGYDNLSIDSSLLDNIL